MGDNFLQKFLNGFVSGLPVVGGDSSRKASKKQRQAAITVAQQVEDSLGDLDGYVSVDVSESPEAFDSDVTSQIEFPAVFVIVDQQDPSPTLDADLQQIASEYGFHQAKIRDDTTSEASEDEKPISTRTYLLGAPV